MIFIIFVAIEQDKMVLFEQTWSTTVVDSIFFMVLLGIHDNKINFKTTTFHFSDYFESGSKYSNYNIQQNENMLDTARGNCQCLGGTLLA